MQKGHTPIDRFPAVTQDIIKAYATLLSSPECSLAPPDRTNTIRQSLIRAGLDGDVERPDQPRWLPNAFSEKSVDGFLNKSLDEAKYAIFVEVLELDATEMMRAYSAGMLEVIRNLDGDFDVQMANLTRHVAESNRHRARGIFLLQWLATTEWGGDAASQALRDFRTMELEVTREAFATFVASQHRFVQPNPAGRRITPQEFLVLASFLSASQLVSQETGAWDEAVWGPTDQPVNTGLVAILAWSFARDPRDPSLEDFLKYLRGSYSGTDDSLTWGTESD